MKKIKGLDSIRFICALWVAVGHLSLASLYLDLSHHADWLFDKFYRILINGPAAVIIFFVISGFCIHYPYRDGRKLLYLEFYARRYIRIGIPAVVAILVAYPMRVHISIFNDAILWSLIAEAIYYTIYPGLLYLKDRIGWKHMIVLSFVIAYAITLLNPTAKNYPSFGVGFNWLLGLPCWLLGCQLAESIESYINLPVSHLGWWRAGVWGASCVCLILRFHSSIGYPYTLNLFGILVYFWLKKEIAHFQHRQPVAILERAGLWSYSLYLTHLLAAALFFRFAPAKVGFWITVPLLLGFTLLTSYLFFLLVERPSHRLAQKFKTLKPTVV